MSSSLARTSGLQRRPTLASVGGGGRTRVVAVRADGATRRAVVGLSVLGMVFARATAPAIAEEESALIQV
jgi:hypothetical protein